MTHEQEVWSTSRKVSNNRCWDIELEIYTVASTQKNQLLLLSVERVIDLESLTQSKTNKLSLGQKETKWEENWKELIMKQAYSTQQPFSYLFYSLIRIAVHRRMSKGTNHLYAHHWPQSLEVSSAVCHLWSTSLSVGILTLNLSGAI